VLEDTPFDQLIRQRAAGRRQAGPIDATTKIGPERAPAWGRTARRSGRGWRPIFDGVGRIGPGPTSMPASDPCLFGYDA